MIVVCKHVINRTRRKHLRNSESSYVARVCLKARDKEKMLPVILRKDAHAAVCPYTVVSVPRSSVMSLPR